MRVFYLWVVGEIMLNIAFLGGSPLSPSSKAFANKAETAETGL